MVEFMLVFPIFILVVIGMLEFGTSFNALLAVNFASRDAALLAAEAAATRVAIASFSRASSPISSAPAKNARIDEVRV